MEFRCEDLPQHGLPLVPSSSPDYEPLLADIQHRLDHPAEGSPPVPEDFRTRIAAADRATSAILLNRSPKAIAAMQVVWRFETEAGRTFRHSQGMLSPQSLLLRFGRSDARLMKLYGYWQTILPGSKRYIGESAMVGDNTDVRPPEPDEIWRGGWVGATGDGGGGSREPIKTITLVLDGVFFLDGEFVGPNREKLFERTVADAEAHRVVSRIARDGHDRGLSPAEIFQQIESATGPAPERPPMMDLAFRNPDATLEQFRQVALQQIAYNFAARRKIPQISQNDDQAIYSLMAWTETVLPDFRRR